MTKEKLTPLTPRENKALMCVLEGKKSRTDCIREAYGCGSDNSCAVIASKVFSRPRVKDKLNELTAAKDQLITKEVASSGVKFVEMLQSNIPKEIIIAKLKEIIESEDKRSSLSAIELITKLLGLQVNKSQILMKQDIYEEVNMLPETFDEVIPEISIKEKKITEDDKE